MNYGQSEVDFIVVCGTLVFLLLLLCWITETVFREARKRKKRGGF